MELLSFFNSGITSLRLEYCKHIITSIVCRFNYVHHLHMWILLLPSCCLHPFRESNFSLSYIYELILIALLIWNNIIPSFYQRPYVPAILQLRSSEILNSRQQTAERFNGMAADERMVWANAAVRQSELVKYSIFCVCLCVWKFVWQPVCVFGCEARPDAVLGQALRRIKGLAL